MQNLRGIFLNEVTFYWFFTNMIIIL